MQMQKIRNFSIIAHIDHGKSTLADRIIQICGSSYKHKIENQILDSMVLERERGITIKAHSVTLEYKTKDNDIYLLNFIDTPGHVDFSYEVSRSLSASEGVLLVIDAGQGIEAQTIANFYAAKEMDLVIIPVLNKIDLPHAQPEHVTQEIENIIGIDASNVVYCSAKTGEGVQNVLERLVRDIPPPSGNVNASLQALIIDSWFDEYAGVVSLVRVKNGILQKGDKIKVMGNGMIYSVHRIGIFTPQQKDCSVLKCGEVGWLICSIKNILSAPVGDTLTHAINPANTPLIGFKKATPQVYAGLFPINPKDYEYFREALKKLSLNDASLSYEPESSIALGLGFRCGFLGLLHMEIVQERLEREYNLNLIATSPTVVYEVKVKNKGTIYVDSIDKLPDLNKIAELREPIVECNILLPEQYIGKVISLCKEKRGVQTNMIFYGKNVSLTYDIPMVEVIVDFFDRLKSISHGYASLKYSFKRFQCSDIVCVHILINGERMDELSFISHVDQAFYRGKILVKRIQELIPRQQFDISIQAAIGKKIIARSTVKQLRKNVIAKCYGGDINRKKKLLQKQKMGKKRMKQIGNIYLPQEIFLNIIHVNNYRK